MAFKIVLSAHNFAFMILIFFYAFNAILLSEGFYEEHAIYEYELCDDEDYCIFLHSSTYMRDWYERRIDFIELELEYVME